MQNASVLITGASGALGGAVSTAFAAAGARLLLVGRRRPELPAEFAAGSQALAVDLSDPAATRVVLGAGIERAGGVDVVCHLAGGFAMGPAVHEIDTDDWQGLFAVNVDTLRHVLQVTVPALRARGGGSIVTVGAAAALRGRAGMGAYCAAKSAVLRLSEALADELLPDGIRVNCVLPGVLDTPANRAAMPQVDRSHWVAPDALADLIVQLCTPGMRALTAAALAVGVSV